MTRIKTKTDLELPENSIVLFAMQYMYKINMDFFKMLLKLKNRLSILKILRAYYLKIRFTSFFILYLNNLIYCLNNPR